MFTDLIGGGSADSAPKTTLPPRTKAAPKPPPEVAALLREAIEAVAREDGYAHLSQIAPWMRQRNPAFDPREFGRSNISGLFRLFPEVFQFKETDGQPEYNWVRIREGAPAKHLRA